MGLKPGYKQTEVGVIPEDWRVVPITDVTREIFLGLTSKVDYVEHNGVPLVRATDIAGGRLSFANARTISIKQHKKLTQYRQAERGDVLVSKSGSLGVCAIVDVDREFSIYESIIVLKPGPDLHSEFLLCLLRDEQTQNRMIGEKVGSSVSHLNLEMFRTLIVPLPPTNAEQRAIAGSLSDVDALIGALDQLIAKKRDLKQAAMQQLLTGQTRLPGFYGEWEVKRLGDLASLKNGYAFKSGTYTAIGIFKVITIANVQDGYMTVEGCDAITSQPTDLQPHQQLKIGDILISMTGNVGRVCRVNEQNCLLNQRVGKLVPTGINADFLFAILGQPSFILAMTSAAKGGAQPNLSATDITGHPFNVPKDTSEQTAIASVLSDMDAELAALAQRRDKTRALKQGMMQELLTGRTRLV